MSSTKDARIQVSSVWNCNGKDPGFSRGNLFRDLPRATVAHWRSTFLPNIARRQPTTTRSLRRSRTGIQPGINAPSFFALTMETYWYSTQGYVRWNLGPQADFISSATSLLHPWKASTLRTPGPRRIFRICSAMRTSAAIGLMMAWLWYVGMLGRADCSIERLRSLTRRSVPRPRPKSDWASVGLLCAPSEDGFPGNVSVML